MPTLAVLHNEAVRLVRQIDRTDKAVRTPFMHDLAETIVAIREHFVTSNGEPDWLGRTFAYRQEIGSIYSDAGISREEAKTLAAAVRYHVMGTLRAKLGDESIKDLGLRVEDGVARSRQNRATAAQERPQGGPVTGPLAARHVAYALSLLRRVPSEDAFAGMTESQRHEVASSLDALARRARSLARSLPK